MTNRRPQRPDSPANRPTTGAPRSPGEQLVPRRPVKSGKPVKFREPRRVHPILRLINGALTFLFVLTIAVAGGAFFLRGAIDQPGPLAKTRTIAVPKGEGSHEIAARLERDGVVSDRRLFIAGYWWQSLAARVGGAKPVSLKAGEYEIKDAMSVRGIVDILNDGRTVLVRVTVPEGLTSFQIVERLKADQGLTGDIAAVPAEGALLPDTYAVQRGASRQFVLDQMAEAQSRMMEKLWAARRDGLPLATIEEAVTLASIVEKETGRNDERDRVAAVFVNRLRAKMRLQSDPTILYGLALGRVQWGKTIYLSEKNSKTAHNTYAIPGLPPTPICNPGRAAIEATLNPAETKELYFVADGRGGHVFAETDKDHQNNVLKWRQIEQARAAAAAGVTPPVAANVVAAPAVKAAPKTPVKPVIKNQAAAPAKTPPKDAATSAAMRKTATQP